MKKILIIAGVLSAAIAMQAADVFKADLSSGQLDFPGKNIWRKNFTIEKEGENFFIHIPPEKGNCSISRMNTEDAELLKKGNFVIQARVRVHGENGHIYLFSLGATAGEEGVRLGIEVRNGKIIPYLNLNFPVGPQKYQRFSIADRKNEQPTGEWFYITAMINRSGKMTLYINGKAVASADISRFSGTEMLGFGKNNASIFTVKTGSFMQYQPLKLEAEYDASVDVAAIKMRTGLLSAMQVKKETK